MSSSKYSEKLGLSWLDTPRQASARSSGSRSERAAEVQRTGGEMMEEALLVYGRPLLEALKESGEEARLYALVDRLDTKLLDLVPLVEHMTARGWVEVAEQDRMGNLLVRITAAGERLLAIMRREIAP